MKRRLPTTYQGETVWAAISLPPVTAEANRQAPSRPHPGRPAAASDAAPIAASANRPAAEGGVTAAPSSSTASAANATPSSRAQRPEPADPAASGFVRHTRPLRGRAHPADATGDLWGAPSLPDCGPPVGSIRKGLGVNGRQEKEFHA